MNYGLYLSASGVLTNLYRQDVFANNLANVQTTGYKPDVPALTQRAPEALEDKLGFEFSDRLLDRLGGGVFAGPQSIDHAASSIAPTGRDLDVALTETGQFFAVQHTNPTTGETSIRLTRNGNFSRGANGTLVTQNGQPVLDTSDQPIVMPSDGKAQISPTGQVLVNGEPVGRLQIARVNDLDRLSKAGQNLFAFTGSDPRTLDAEALIRPGALESSGADPIKTLMSMISATKAATGNANMMRYFDTMMDRTVNTLGRVS